MEKIELLAQRLKTKIEYIAKLAGDISFAHEINSLLEEYLIELKKSKKEVVKICRQKKKRTL